MANTSSGTKKKKLEKTVIEPRPKSYNTVYCCRCGKAFPRLDGNFPASHSPMYRGSGHLPFCKNCVDEMYNTFVHKYGDERKAMRRMCMMMDLYWSEQLYESVSHSSTVSTRVRAYIRRTNMIRYIDKDFGDTLDEEAKRGAMTADHFVPAGAAGHKVSSEPSSAADQGRPSGNMITDTIDDIPEMDPESEEIEIADEVKEFWGPGFTNSQYAELEQRRSYWMSRIPDQEDIDVGTEALIRQICNVEVDINRDRAAGKSVDKYVNTWNSLLGSLNMRPVQRKTDEADSELERLPFGVGIKWIEEKRPIKECDPELQDVDGIVKYIDIFFKGHLAKMLGLKNIRSASYDKFMDKYRVTKPEYKDEDSEALFDDIFGGFGDEDGD